MRLDKKIALITGAAQGQGEAVAKRFSKENCKLILVDKNKKKLKEVNDYINQNGGSSICYQIDITNEKNVKILFEKIKKIFDHIDILYNNAGIYDLNDAPTAELEIKKFDEIVEINLKGVFLFCHYCIPLLIKKNNSVILNVGSVASYAGDSNAHAYAASKGSMLAYTRSLANYYGRFGLRANVICPGFIDTPMVEKFINDKSIKNQIINSTMLGRFGKPDDVANLALFLASDEATFITGGNYVVDGGLIK
tara:strand:- start:1387 stop:2139 length:753 start_codon:yes stop_codon:yes gene_type:complete